jgi:hypothetical protein
VNVGEDATPRRCRKSAKCCQLYGMRSSPTGTYGSSRRPMSCMTRAYSLSAIGSRHAYCPHGRVTSSYICARRLRTRRIQSMQYTGRRPRAALCITALPRGVYATLTAYGAASEKGDQILRIHRARRCRVCPLSFHKRQQIQPALERSVAYGSGIRARRCSLLRRQRRRTVELGRRRRGWWWWLRRLRLRVGI